MTSKHEPHEPMILSLLSRGISYRQIAQELTAQGCKTDASAVYRWVKSRAARIASRASLIDPLATALTAPLSTSLSISGSPHVRPNAGVVKPAASPTLVGALQSDASAYPGDVCVSDASISDAQAMQVLDALIEQSASAKSLLKKK